MLPNKVHLKMGSNQVWNWRYVPSQVNKAIGQNLKVKLELLKQDHIRMRKEKAKTYFATRAIEQKKVNVFHDFDVLMNISGEAAPLDDDEYTLLG